MQQESQKPLHATGPQHADKLNIRRSAEQLGVPLSNKVAEAEGVIRLPLRQL